LILFVALAVVGLLAPCGLANTGTVIKYSQPITHLIDPNWPTNMDRWGEDIPSDVDWNSVMLSSTIPPNWVVADDFEDPFKLPVITVRWWGSYVGPTFGPNGQTLFGPGSEDGYAISFFRDVPDPDGNRDIPTGFSRPDGLLGTYVLPFEKVRIKETPYVGWDMHPIFEYEADLMDAHLDHPVTPYADPNGFNQIPGERYWISIIAEVGHKLELIQPTPDAPPIWISEDTGKRAQDHYWGWHTSPLERFDLATMGHLFMPGNQWDYFGWMPIQPQHHLFDMAFELLTVPEPATLVLTLVAAVGSASVLRRRRVSQAK
jgi:hypothetical protein